MTLFDIDAISVEGIIPDVVTFVNEVIDRLRLMKVESISVSGDCRTANLVRCYIQAHIRRCITYIEAGYAEFRTGRSLIATTCARANYENVAAFVDYKNLLIPLLKTGDHSEIRKFVDVRAFSTRIPSILEEHGRELAARNILTQIDKMNSNIPTYRTAYDHLSDAVHPNAFGAVLHFVSFDEGSTLAMFLERGRNPEWALSSLILSGALLAHVESSIVEIERHLVELSAPYQF